MILSTRHFINSGKKFQGYALRVTFIALMGGCALFIGLWVFGSTHFERHFFETTSHSISERGSQSSLENRFRIFYDVRRNGKRLDDTKVLPKPENRNNIPTTILAAGDIAKCDGEEHWREKVLQLVGIVPDRGPQEPFIENFLELLSLREETDYPANAALTASLILRLPGRVLALGDLVYPTGSTQQFQECYESTWGQFKRRTYPVPGNHEYKQHKAEPYFTYWGHRAGEFGKGYYSFKAGAWHIIALNSKIEKEHHKDSISAQHAWLQKDLAEAKADCILAYWHHPVFSSGQHSGTPRMKRILETLYNFGVTVVLTGHAHHYERFALQNPEGDRDPVHGFRQFIVGTGGVPLRPLKKRHNNSEIFRADSYGVLRLDLYSNDYAWQFLPVNDVHPHDKGTGSCVSPQRPKPLSQNT